MADIESISEGWPGCHVVITDRTTKEMRYCTWPIVDGERFCARHGGKRKTKQTPFYTRSVNAMAQRIVRWIHRFWN